MINIYDLYKCTADSFPDRPSVIFNGKVYLFRDIAGRIDSLAYGFYACGLRPGMVAGMLLYNGVDFFCTFYALHKLGCVVLPLNWRLTAGDIAGHIAQSQCAALIYDGSLQGKLGDMATDIIRIPTVSENGDCLEKMYALKPNGWAFKPELSPSDPAQYLLTGGTSSEAKIAVATQEAMVMRVLLPRLYNTLDYSPDDNFLIFNPMFHQGGIGIFLPVSIAGGCVTIMEHFDIGQLLENIQKHKVTRLIMLPPSLCRRIADYPGIENYDLSSVRRVLLTGGESSVELAECVFRLFPNADISSSYGATENAAETMHVYTRQDYAANPKIAASVGRLSPFSQLRLITEDGKDARPGQMGECCGRSPIMFSGYLGRPSPFEDGWFRTGDCLTFDENGYYYFCERKNFVIKSGGELVLPGEVETALLGCPGVKKAAVFGVPDKYLGEKVAAAVVPEAGARLSADGITDYLKAHIASYKKPRDIMFVDDLIYTGVGKVDKRALQELFWSRQNNKDQNEVKNDEKALSADKDK